MQTVLQNFVEVLVPWSFNVLLVVLLWKVFSWLSYYKNVKNVERMKNVKPNWDRLCREDCWKVKGSTRGDTKVKDLPIIFGQKMKP